MMHFPTPWVVFFCYLSLVERQKVGILEKCYLGSHFLRSFIYGFGFAVRVC